MDWSGPGSEGLVSMAHPFSFLGPNLRVGCRIGTLLAVRGISWQTILVRPMSLTPQLNTSLYPHYQVLPIMHAAIKGILVPLVQVCRVFLKQPLTVQKSSLETSAPTSMVGPTSLSYTKWNFPPKNQLATPPGQWKGCCKVSGTLCTYPANLGCWQAVPSYLPLPRLLTQRFSYSSFGCCPRACRYCAVLHYLYSPP